MLGSSLFHDMLDYVSFSGCKSLTILTEIPPLFSLLFPFFHFDFVPPLEMSAPLFPFLFGLVFQSHVLYFTQFGGSLSHLRTLTFYFRALDLQFYT